MHSFNACSEFNNCMFFENLIVRKWEQGVEGIVEFDLIEGPCPVERIDIAAAS